MKFMCVCGQRFSSRIGHDRHFRYRHSGLKLRMKPENRQRPGLGQVGLKRVNMRRSKSPLHWLDGSLKYKKISSGCWIWQGYVDRLGYGHADWKGTSYKAHRACYEIYKGKIPDGLVLDHLCRTPSCVNPAHLEAVTMAENNRRGVRSKLSHETVIKIKSEWKTGKFRPVDIARKYNIRPLAALRIVRGISWRGVGD